jgi:predicted regulator of Ras-like GTPase activity (Roadblock/LC7/MglB family)
VQSILNKITKIAGVRGAVLVGEDGLEIASDLSGGEDPNAMGAAVSAMQTAMGTALAKLGKGAFRRSILSGQNGTAVIFSVGGRASAIITLRPEANIGLVLVELKESARELSEKIQL